MNPLRFSSSSATPYAIAAIMLMVVAWDHAARAQSVADDSNGVFEPANMFRARTGMHIGMIDRPSHSSRVRDRLPSPEPGDTRLLATNGILRAPAPSSADSSPVVAPADSLPTGMPIHTRILWGRNGLIRLIGLAPSSRRNEFFVRRSMLQWHQRMGLITFGLLTTQVVLGELLARNPARYYDDIRPFHKGMGYVTAAAYFTTAGLSIGAPPAWRYGRNISSIRVHRWLAVVHLAGMTAQPFLGRSLANATTGESYDRRLNRHQWVGRVTWISFTSAIITTFLP